MTDAEIVLRMRRNGHPIASIAARFGCTAKDVLRVLRAAGEPEPEHIEILYFATAPMPILKRVA